ncbi:acyl carrier protein [Pseudarcicella hirudinis]|uniref:Acyl carrier protein n=1 Tax=Pseudarcicella hirudinis TaxID=1079859 RepID=A0A1I5VUR2_9BACT|nr:acyl carrier protein [Pseudarcicella hirudinis]SFQ11205.1 acyl carrier protein [Pseudarcicella hirudinis]
MKFNYEKFQQFLSRNFHIRPTLIQPWKNLRSDLGLNSLEYLEVIVHLENTYHVNLPDEEIHNIQTVKQLTELMERNLVLVNA